MNVLFLTIGRINGINDRTIYSDLLKRFVEKGHRVYAVCPNERKYKKPTEYTAGNGFELLKVKTGNLQKCNIIEKGISTVRIESQYKKAIRKYFGNVKFDLVMYSTPPITLASVIKYIKKRDGAVSYLMLKDIFPQNAVDMGMMSKKGAKGLLYRYFRRKEEKLYAFSDRIGCMSEANVEYVIKHNPGISADKVEVCPNSIEVRDLRLDGASRSAMREKYGIPKDKTVLVYGGNLGKPQGVPFITECVRGLKDNSRVHFLIVGDGTEYGKLEEFVKSGVANNLTVMKSLPKEEYDAMIASCDAGLIFLDHRFTVPNFPSRLLSYMQAALPVLACTDASTDVGRVIEQGHFGRSCESNSVSGFCRAVSALLEDDLCALGQNGYLYLNSHYTVDIQYGIITESVKKLKDS